MRPSEQWENLADVIRAIEPTLEAKLRLCQHHAPDPATKPVSAAIVAVYVSRIESALAAIRGGGKSLREDAVSHPNASEELQEIESWILRRKPNAPGRKLTDKDWDAFGNWFVSKMGYSYSRAREMIERLRNLQSSKGAPNKRTETLKMLDARIANEWSYMELANKMCDCGALKHTEHCSERIRKRLKELESFLKKYGIQVPGHPGEK